MTSYIFLLPPFPLIHSPVLYFLIQAAFIRNPDYPGESAGPEIVTLGHNPYKPNVVRA